MELKPQGNRFANCPCNIFHPSSPGHSESFPKPLQSTRSSPSRSTQPRSIPTLSRSSTIRIRPTIRIIPTKVSDLASRSGKLIRSRSTWIAKRSRCSRPTRALGRRQCVNMEAEGKKGTHLLRIFEFDDKARVVQRIYRSMYSHLHCEIYTTINPSSLYRIYVYVSKSLLY